MRDDSARHPHRDRQLFEQFGVEKHFGSSRWILSKISAQDPQEMLEFLTAQFLQAQSEKHDSFHRYVGIMDRGRSHGPSGLLGRFDGGDDTAELA